MYFFPLVELGMVEGDRTPLKCRNLCAPNLLLLWDMWVRKPGRRGKTRSFLWAAHPLGKALASLGESLSVVMLELQGLNLSKW